MQKDCRWNPSTYIYENNKHLKSIVHESVIATDDIISVTDSVLTNVINSLSKNVEK